jgi:hypothetical protein
LRENVEKDQKIIAMPYDSLYCFLSDRGSAVRPQEMFMYRHPSERQERRIIEQIDRENIQWVVLSNRYRSTERGLGTFGQTHCRLLSEYISGHFRPVVTYGPWEKNPSEWIKNHAVMILKRDDRGSGCSLQELRKWTSH